MKTPGHVQNQEVNHVLRVWGNLHSSFRP